MSALFESTIINGMSLAIDLFVPRRGRDGTPMELAPADYRHDGELVEGAVGLIITGHSYVSREGQAGPWQLGIHEDACCGADPDDRTPFIECGKICSQLAHAGAEAAAHSLAWRLSASVLLRGCKAICREMSKEDIDRIVRAFGDAAARANVVASTLSKSTPPTVIC